MTENEFLKFVVAHEAQHMFTLRLYAGRGLEQVLLGDTGLYHRLTCYVQDKAQRLNILFDAINGMTELELVKKYGHYISREAPCWNN